MIIFKNPGLIPMLAITTMGLNVKENTQAIGHFGTGLKYALSVLLREGCSIILYRGKKRHVFGLSVQTVRGKKFEFVTLDGEPMSFTTELGKGWEPWQAFRELWCNAKDEHGEIFDSETLPERQAGETMIVVKGQAIDAAFADRWSTVLVGEPDFKFTDLEMQARRSTHIYYRGIRAMDTPGDPMIYTYNLIGDHELTEDRTIKYGSWAMDGIARAVLRSSDKEFLRDFLTIPEGYMEHKINLNLHGVVPTDALLEVLSSNRESLSQAARNLFDSKRIQSTSKVTERVRVGLTEAQKAVIAKAKELCGTAGFPIHRELVFVSQLPNNREMEHRKGRFVYHINILEQGVNYFAMSMLQETLSLNDGRGSVALQLAGVVLGVQSKPKADLKRLDDDDEMPF